MDDGLFFVFDLWFHFAFLDLGVTLLWKEKLPLRSRWKGAVPVENDRW